MKRFLYILLFTALVFVSVDAKAQFSISKVKPTKTETANIPDTIKLRTDIDNEFFSQALYDHERRVLRKQRNTTEFNSTLQLSQTQFENWAPGGDNTFSGRTTIFFKHVHQRKKFSMETRFEARYGLNYIEGKRFKNEDEFKLNLRSGWKMHRNWSYTANMGLRSQFSTGYKSRTNSARTSTFMAPGFFDLSVGFRYDKKPFVFIVSPIGGSAVFVLDRELREMGINRVPKGKSSKWHMGPSIKAELDMEFAKKVFRLRSYLDAFSNLDETLTMRWETTLDIRATKFLTTTIYALTYFDKEAETPKRGRMQYKYSFSVGLSYTFRNK